MEFGLGASDRRLPRPGAMLFDMDGTITAPLLDFARIRAEMGIGGRGIFEALSGMSDTDRSIAEAVLHRHEDDAAARSTLNPGCRELLRWIKEHTIKSALITRNRRASAETVMKLHGLQFEALLTRESGAFKPDPTPLLLACKLLDVSPLFAWMVGDGIFDVRAGLAAKMTTIWLGHGREREFIEEPTRTVRDLPDLLALLQSTTKSEACL